MSVDASVTYGARAGRDPQAHGGLEPRRFNGQDIASAAKLKWGDLEDCLIAVSAGKANADYIITRDRKGFERSLVPTATPGEWLRGVREEEGVAFDGFSLH